MTKQEKYKAKQRERAKFELKSQLKKEKQARIKLATERSHREWLNAYKIKESATQIRGVSERGEDVSSDIQQMESRDPDFQGSSGKDFSNENSKD